MYVEDNVTVHVVLFCEVSEDYSECGWLPELSCLYGVKSGMLLSENIITKN